MAERVRFLEKLDYEENAFYTEKHKKTLMNDSQGNPRDILLDQL